MYSIFDGMIYTANWYLYVDSLNSVAVKLVKINAENMMRIGKDGW